VATSSDLRIATIRLALTIKKHPPNEFQCYLSHFPSFFISICCSSLSFFGVSSSFHLKNLNKRGEQAKKSPQILENENHRPKDETNIFMFRFAIISDRSEQQQHQASKQARQARQASKRWKRKNLKFNSPFC